MLVDSSGRPIATGREAAPDPIDGYVPRTDDGFSPGLIAQIKADVAQVQQTRADQSAGVEVPHMDAAWAQGVELDGYVNEVSGLGVLGYDKTLGTGPTGVSFAVHRFSGIEAEMRSRGSDLGNRIVSVIPDEMTREGWDLQVQPTDEAEADALEPRQQLDASMKAPRRAAAGWRQMAKATMDRGRRMDALRNAARWDAFGAPGAPMMAGPPPAPPPPGPLPHISDEGIELSEAMTDRMDKLDLLGAVNQALRYERAFGGGAIMIGADDGATDLTQPLDEKNVKSIQHLTPYFGGYDGEVVAWRWYADPRKPLYGQPEVYQLRNLGVPISRPPAPGETHPTPTILPTGPGGPYVWYVHESRLLLFPGDALTRRTRVEMRGWGDSVFTRADQVLSQFDQSWSGLAILLQELSVATLKIKNLAVTLADPKKKGVVLERARQIAISKSIARIALLDSEEEFGRVTASLAGAPELMGQFLLRLAGAVDMPVSLLVGQVQGGLGNTGNTDVRFFYDKIKSYIARRLIPRVLKIYRLAWLAKDSPTRGVLPERWSIVPRELWQLTASETATLRETYAKIDASNITAGIYSPEEAAASRYGGSEFGTEIVLDIEGRNALAAKEEEERKAAPPPEQVQPTPTPAAKAPDGTGSVTTIPPMNAMPVDPISGDPQGTPSTVAEPPKAK